MQKKLLENNDYSTYYMYVYMYMCAIDDVSNACSNKLPFVLFTFVWYSVQHRFVAWRRRMWDSFDLAFLVFDWLSVDRWRWGGRCSCSW